ncbi:hypothetical protein HDU92_000575, partial [Lobulomyces angularis]
TSSSKTFRGTGIASLKNPIKPGGFKRASSKGYSSTTSRSNSFGYPFWIYYYDEPQRNVHQCVDSNRDRHCFIQSKSNNSRYYGIVTDGWIDSEKVIPKTFLNFGFNVNETISDNCRWYRTNEIYDQDDDLIETIYIKDFNSNLTANSLYVNNTEVEQIQNILLNISSG